MITSSTRAGARYVLAVDQGTTSTRSILFDASGRLVAVRQREHSQHFPQPGWVEHDALEIWRNLSRLIPETLADAGVTTHDVAALGIANQRETTLVWDRRTGTPICPALVWQDTRTAPYLDALEARGLGDEIRARTGLPLATYFSAPKLKWILDNVPGARSRANRGELLAGTMESWLIWNFTGGVHVTDVTNASRSMLMDIRTLQWDVDLIDIFDVPRRILPEIRPSLQIFGTCTGALEGVPIAAALGDQQAALFGQTCFDAGDAKCTYGTGAFLLMHTGTAPVISERGLIPTIAYQLEGAPANYALEGSIAVAGSLVQWLRDQIGLVRTAPEIETLARTVKDNGGCYIVPAFGGLYAPHWRGEARGVIAGLTAYVNKGHLARAVLEATGWQTREVVDAMNADSGIPLTALRVDGGMTANNLLMQFIADVLDTTVVRPMMAETVSLGAAYAAGVSIGLWPDFGALRRNWHRAAEWLPTMQPSERERQFASWKLAVTRSFDWVK